MTDRDELLKAAAKARAWSRQLVEASRVLQEGTAQTIRETQELIARSRRLRDGSPPRDGMGLPRAPAARGPLRAWPALPTAPGGGV